MIPSFCFIVYSIEDFKNKDSMGTLQLQDISLAFSDRDILSHISCTVDTNTRAALAGANGSGKSTLLKIITGSMDADSGTITATKGMQISYLPQGASSSRTEASMKSSKGPSHGITTSCSERNVSESSLPPAVKTPGRPRRCLRSSRRLKNTSCTATTTIARHGSCRLPPGSGSLRMTSTDPPWNSPGDGR